MTEIYDKDSIKTIESIEHIRLRPGMYIGKLGDGSSPDDGIYVMLKEIVDNSIDEFLMGEGKTIDVNVSEDGKIQVRDYGRGIPLEKVVAAVSIMNTGAKYDSSVFKKSVGLNGVGSKAVNALSSEFIVESVRDGKIKRAEFTAGKLVREFDITTTKERGGTFISFIPDEELFPKFHFIPEYIEKMLWNYCYLNEGLTINYNDTRLVSKNGIVDLLNNEIDSSPLYPIVHIKDQDFEFAFTHINTQYGEEYFSFVNGQHTTQGGTHQSAFREAFARTVKEFYKKDYDTQDIRTSLVAAISIKVVEPVFESQTKTKLGSVYMEKKDGETIRNYILNSVKKNLDDYLHIHSDIAEAMLAKIHLSERERKEIADFKKITRERSKKTSLRNEKLRDCRLHYNESYKNEKDEERRLSTTIFITEGNSATGSITKIRDVNTQAVFSLRGKPLNSYGLGKKVVYENEEFNLLQAALNIGEELEGLRYNNIVIATDADVDGMHIRLLLLTFFLQFFPDIVRHGHVYVLQTPLFRVRNKQKTIYCYSEDEKTAALRGFGTAANKGSVEITRFKGLGEISPDEFKVFIGSGMRLDPVIMKKDQNVRELLTFYMGKNTPDRQGFIIDNLRIDVD
ncbi:MAG: ATP-binding protein [Bacteroidales bacterium]|jgi:topoisomerase-4 subunit B|nr:ATP-binding protein [Bacteroidales bacterium]